MRLASESYKNMGHIKDILTACRNDLVKARKLMAVVAKRNILERKKEIQTFNKSNKD